jgi:hypothetical protein
MFCSGFNPSSLALFVFSWPKKIFPLPKKMARQQPCICGYDDIRNMARHKRKCNAIATMFDEQNERHARLAKKVRDLENGDELRRLRQEIKDLKTGDAHRRLEQEKEEWRTKYYELLETAKRQKVVHDNRQYMNIINITFPYGEEPKLTDERMRSILSLASKMPHPQSGLSHTVPLVIKEKHFKDEKTANIRIEDDKIETVRRDEKTGELMWKKERKPAQKFCEDLAKTTIQELNEVCARERGNLTSFLWRSYHEPRFGKDPDPDHANCMQLAGTEVCNMLKEQALKDEKKDKKG